MNKEENIDIDIEETETAYSLKSFKI